MDLKTLATSMAVSARKQHPNKNPLGMAPHLARELKLTPQESGAFAQHFAWAWISA